MVARLAYLAAADLYRDKALRRDDFVESLALRH